jgi:uncharacterized protein YjbJ (UPF0337 family)
MERKETAMTKPGPKEAVEGAVEGAKGRLKKTVGALTGDEQVEQEGQAQEEKAVAQREAAKHEGQADLARAKARVAEVEERSHQDR